MTNPKTFFRIITNKRYLAARKREAAFCRRNFKIWVSQIQYYLECIAKDGYFIEEGYLYTIQISKTPGSKYTSKKNIYFIKF